MRHSENNTNFSVKYCNSCEHPWENIYGKLMTYSDFPTYGLQRKTCSKCIKKQQRNDNKPCSECGYYEDNIAWHYEDCSKMMEDFYYA